MNYSYDATTIYLAEHPGFPLEWNILFIERIQRAISRFNLDMRDSLLPYYVLKYIMEIG